MGARNGKPAGEPSSTVGEVERCQPPQSDDATTRGSSRAGGSSSDFSPPSSSDLKSMEYAGNLREHINRVSLVLFRHLHMSKNATPSVLSLGFDEELYRTRRWQVLAPQLSCNEGMLTVYRTKEIETVQTPTPADLTKFIVGFALCGVVSPESLIIALIYIERLIDIGVQLLPRTWRSVLLGALILSAKMWEDTCVCWNSEFTATGEYSIESVNALERHFMKTLGYRLHVSGKEYARYHFALREMRKPGPSPRPSHNFRSHLAARVGVVRAGQMDGQPVPPVDDYPSLQE
jgi:hypothetical protein